MPTWQSHVSYTQPVCRCCLPRPIAALPAPAIAPVAALPTLLLLGRVVAPPPLPRSIHRERRRGHQRRRDVAPDVVVAAPGRLEPPRLPRRPAVERSPAASTTVVAAPRCALVDRSPLPVLLLLQLLLLL